MIARVFLAAVLVLAVSGQTAPPSARRETPAQAAPQSAATRAEDAEVEALRADLQHMRSLVGQMQRNIAFVDSGLTPLKHQLQLEIDAWNIVINDMQRRLDAVSKK